MDDWLSDVQPEADDAEADHQFEAGDSGADHQFEAGISAGADLCLVNEASVEPTAWSRFFWRFAAEPPVVRMTLL